jgi:hypothetical protein
MTANQSMRRLSDYTSGSLKSENLLRPSNCSAAVAAEGTRLLFGAYRKGEAHDPDTLVASIVAILTLYPEWVVRRVTDPRTGLAGKSQFMPNVFDVRQACEAEMKSLRESDMQRARTEHNRIVLASVPAHDRSAAIGRLKLEYPEVFVGPEGGSSLLAPLQEGDPNWSAAGITASTELKELINRKSGRDAAAN